MFFPEEFCDGLLLQSRHDHGEDADENSGNKAKNKPNRLIFQSSEP